jgi:hypothetical protein
VLCTRKLPSNPSRTNAHIIAQELKAHNKAAKIEMERARAADHAPNIPEFVPSLEAQQLPGLSQVVLGFWVVRELHDRKHASVAKHINPPCFVADGSVPHIGTFNQRYMRRQRFHNAMMSMFCGNRHAIPPPRRVGPAARLPTVGVEGAVQLEQPLPAQPQQAGAGNADGSRIAAGNADARSARQQTKRARRSIGTSGARRTGGSGIGEQMLMAKATQGCLKGRGRASPSCSSACAARASSSNAGGTAQINCNSFLFLRESYRLVVGSDNVWTPTW